MTAKSAPRPPARRPASLVQTTLRALVDEARPSGRLTLTLFGPHEPGAVIAEILAASVAARAWADAIPHLMRGAQPDCATCGARLGVPAAIGIFHADRPDARAVVALACCDACTMEGPAVLRKKLMNFLGTIFPGLRAGAPTHGAPASLQ